MSKVTIDIADDNLQLLLEVTDLLEIGRNSLKFEEVPDWHKQILNERMEAYKAGKFSPSSWEEFRQELDNEETDEL